MSSLSSTSSDLRLLLAERERRSRLRFQNQAKRDDAIQAARDGDPRPYVNLQWPLLELDPWQWQALEWLCDPTIRTVAVKGNTGCGKNAIGGIWVCLYYDLFDDAKVRITRDNHPNAVKIAFGEVDKWFRRTRYRPDGNLLSEQIDGGKEHWAAVSNPKADEGFHGVHSEHVAFWFDEATADVLEGRFQAVYTQAHKFLCTANPRTLGGSFRDLFPADDPDENQVWTTLNGRVGCITVSGWDCRNVREGCLKRPVAPVGGVEIDGHKFDEGELIPAEDVEKRKPIIPGQTCYDEFMQLLHGDDFTRNVFALGKFPDEDPEKQIIVRSWLSVPNKAHNRWRQLMRRAEEHEAKHRHIALHVGNPTEPEPYGAVCALNRILPVEAFGLDVGGSKHGDPSVLTAGGRGGIRAQFTTQQPDAIKLCQWCIDTAEKKFGVDLKSGQYPVGIDTVGIGWGLPSIFQRQGVFVVEIRGNDPSEVDPKRYANKRAESYGELGARLNPDGSYSGQTFMVPEDRMLTQELTVPEKLFKSDGLKFAITPKRKVTGVKSDIKSIEEKIGRSPDRGDSAVYFHRALQACGASLEQYLDAGFF